MAVFHLIYRSEASHELSGAQLAAMLQRARGFNQAHGITGILLFGDGQYAQVLEGEQPVVEALYARICRDKCHRSVQTLTQGQTRRRVFPAWHMGFLATSSTDFRRLVGHVDPARFRGPLPHAHPAGPGLLALLEEFALAHIVQF